MTDVVVIGAGIAGVACARRCADAGLAVQVLDRGRRAGGRMATRTLRTADGPHPTDTGAPYFTASDPGFRSLVDGWLQHGLVREWTDTFHTAGPLGLREAKTGPLRYASTRGIRTLVEDLGEGLAIEQERDLDEHRVHDLVDDRHTPAVVLAMPGPQAARLLHRHFADVAAIADQPYDPALALVARYEHRHWPDFDGAFVTNVPELRWVADDGRARGDGAPVLVAHSTPSFAREHLDDPGAAAGTLLQAMRVVLGVHGEPVETHVQRWTFAQPTGEREATFHLGDDGLGLAGDGWSRKSRVEAAWRSGTDLGDAIVARLA